MRIGTAEFHVDTRTVERNGSTVAIEPRAAGVLLELAKRPGEVLSRDTLLQLCWDDLEGSDEALTQAIAQVRRAFDDKATAPRYIQTIRKSGYRLIAPVENNLTLEDDFARSSVSEAETDAETVVARTTRRHLVGPRITFAFIGAVVLAAGLLRRVEAEQFHFVKTS